MMKNLNILFRFPIFLKNFIFFKFLDKFHRFLMRWRDCYPCLNDNNPTANFDRHYIYHTAWAARILAKTLPQQHIDISSSLYFSALVSAFVPIKFYDYRKTDIELTNLTSGKADLLSLPFSENSIPSLSCMHVIEHIGLGRYGDPLDPDGDLKAIQELTRVLSPKGDLLFVVPVGGQPRINFNAHRIYSYEQIISYFKELELIEFTLICESPQTGGFITHPSTKLLQQQRYGCGCFWFKK